MMKRNTFIILFIIGVWILPSCKTYLIPLESFEHQFAGIDSTSLKEVRIEGAAYDTYLANPINKIDCIDKQGNAFQLDNSPAIEIRFTYGEKNKRTIFYFDRVIKQDTLIIGGQSRFIPSLIKAIPFNSVSKIEVQNGGKNFKYVEN
nr:hypothetical protein [uncultured Draconibacterium sp.]